MSLHNEFQRFLEKSMMNHASIYILEQHETTKQIRNIERVHMTLILNCKNMLIWTLYGRIFDQTLQRAT